MKIKNERDFFAGLVFIVLGVLFGIGVPRYAARHAVHDASGSAIGSALQPGPAYFPIILSLLLAMLGAVVLFKSLAIETEGGGRIGRIAWRPLAAVLVSVMVFGAGVDVLGLMLAVPLLIVLCSLACDEFTWSATLIGAVMLTALSWFVFVVVLKMGLPMWPRLPGP